MRLLVVASDPALRAGLTDAVARIERHTTVDVREMVPPPHTDPVEAMAAALTAFPADELLVATEPPGRSSWLEDDVIARACARFGLPVAHVPVEAADRDLALAA